MANAYNSYREPRMRWLPPVPAHWLEQRAKTFFREVDERSRTGQEELLSVSHITGVTPRSQKKVSMFKAASYVGAKLARPGDIVINTLWAWMAALGTSRHLGIVSPAYGVYRPHDPSSFNPSYLDYLLRTRAYVSEYIGRSTGIRSSRLRLYPAQFLDIPLLQPSRAEQDQIVAFLRARDSHLARLIKAKRELIGLMKEQRRNIIRRAVTEGVGSSSDTRPSGIEWLPSVPSRWSVGSVRSEMQCLNRRRAPLSATERGRLQGPYDYYGASGVIDHVVDFIFDDDLLLIAEDGANLVNRNLPLAIVAKGKFWVNNHAHILKPRKGSLEYFAHLMECIDYRPWISGAAQPKLTKDRLLGIRIPVPSPTEQEEIVRQIKIDVADPESAIQRATEEIALLLELRERQIADVVTGQVDVRNWQPGPEDQITEEDLTALGDDDDNDTTEEETDGDDGHD